MLSELLDAAQGFASSSVAGLLRTAPDLEPLVGYIDSLYHSPESGTFKATFVRTFTNRSEKTIEILPNDGADAECDKRSAEVQELEAALDSLLRKAKKDIKYASETEVKTLLIAAALKLNSGIPLKVERIFTISKYLSRPRSRVIGPSSLLLVYVLPSRTMI